MSDFDGTSRDSATRRPVIGGSDRRIDSLGKVTGQARYAEDMTLPGMLHACVLRSPHHHARLLALDTVQAEQMPGVARVITAQDVPGENNLEGYSKDEPLLTPVGDTLRQKGAPLALVVAGTPEQARRAAAAIQVEYQVLPHVFDAGPALQAGAVQIYPAGNVLSSHTLKHGDLEAAFAAAQVIVETDYQTAFQEHSTTEREAALSYLDEAGRVTVIAGTHEPHWQTGYIAQALGIDPARVRVIVPPTGGSFGSRQDPWPLMAAGLATYLLRCPVRLAYSRREVFDATPKRHPYHIQMKVGAQADGRLTGIRVRVDANTGGYDSAGYWISNYAVTASGGAYDWQAVDAYAQAVYTNGPKCGQFRGFGTPQSVFALECTLDELAQKLDADPWELRYRNRLHQGAKSFLGYPVGESLGYAQVLEAIRPRYQALAEEARAFNAAAQGGIYRMAAGLAGMWYRFGKSGSLRIETHAELAGDGHFVVYCSAPDYGQGIATVMVQLAAEALGVPQGRIELVNADTARTPDSNVQGASRATYFIGSSVVKSVENLRSQIFAVAAEMLDHNPDDLLLGPDRVLLRSDPGRWILLSDVASEFDLLGKARKTTGLFDLSAQFDAPDRPEYLPIFVTGAHVAQVVVDMQTGQVTVKRIAAAHDVGRAINPTDAAGQIEGAVVMGIGSALMEEYLPGVTTGFTDYVLPMINAMPEIETLLVEVPSFYGPHGAKGLGEAAMLPVAPAIINAVSRAVGARLRRLPATPQRVLEAIRARSDS